MDISFMTEDTLIFSDIDIMGCCNHNYMVIIMFYYLYWVQEKPHLLALLLESPDHIAIYMVYALNNPRTKILRFERSHALLYAPALLPTMLIVAIVHQL